MNNVTKLINVLNDEGIYFTDYTSPRGLTFDLEVKTNNQIQKAQLFLDESVGIKSIEIHSMVAVKPELYWNVQRMLYDINKRQRAYFWNMTHSGYYYLWALPDVSWHEIEIVPKMLRKMQGRFALYSPHLDKLGQGEKAYSDIYQEMKHMGIIQ